MKCQLLDDSYKNEWEELVAHVPESGFMQTYAWADFKEKVGWNVVKIGIFEGNKLVGGAFVHKFYYGDTSFLYIPEGPVLGYSEESNKPFDIFIKYISSLVSSSKEYPVTHLRIEPRLQTMPGYIKNFVKAPYNMEPKQTLLIDLSASEDNILSSMKSKGRYNIKVANRHGILVRQSDNFSNFNIFNDLYQETEKRNKFKGKEETYFNSLISTVLADKKGKFYIAELNGKPLSIAFVVSFGKRVTFLFGGSSNTDKEKMAPYLLQWEIIKDAKEKGYQQYDLWGIAENEENTHSSWYGFTKFKRQFGGQRVDFIGTYDLVYNQSLYEKFLYDSGEITLITG